VAGDGGLPHPLAGTDHGHFLISDFVTITDGAIPQQAALECFFMNFVLKLGAEAVVPWLVVSTSGCVWRPARIP